MTRQDDGTEVHPVCARILSEQRPGEQQQDFAERAGTSKQTVNNWQNGQGISLDTVARVCDRLGLSLDWVVLGREPRYAPAGSASRRLRVIGQVADGRISDDALAALMGGSTSPDADVDAPPSAEQIDQMVEGSKPAGPDQYDGGTGEGAG